MSTRQEQAKQLQQQWETHTSWARQQGAAGSIRRRRPEPQRSVPGSSAARTERQNQGDGVPRPVPCECDIAMRGGLLHEVAEPTGVVLDGSKGHDLPCAFGESVE